MRPGFFPGDLPRPPSHEPGQHLREAISELRGEQGLGLELPVGVPNQYPAQGYGREARVIPHRRVRADLHLSGATAIPIVNGQ